MYEGDLDGETVDPFILTTGASLLIKLHIPQNNIILMWQKVAQHPTSDTVFEMRHSYGVFAIFTSFERRLMICGSKSMMKTYNRTPDPHTNRLRLKTREQRTLGKPRAKDCKHMVWHRNKTWHQTKETIRNTWINILLILSFACLCKIKVGMKWKLWLFVSYIVIAYPSEKLLEWEKKM